jgi:alpha-beta hydrolase superfamily lysophospholipase
MRQRAIIAAFALLTFFVSIDAAEKRYKPVCKNEDSNLKKWKFVAWVTGMGAKSTLGKDVSHRTSDGITLRGYKISSWGEPAEGAILFIHGNAMKATAIADDLDGLADGFDVYVYDYRGYARSGGRSSFLAFLSDYNELFASLRRSYSRVYVYGASIGGVIALNLSGEAATVPTVIDSAPATLKIVECSGVLNPVARLAPHCSRLLIITGGSDRVIPADELRQLRDAASACGAKAVHNDGWAHPFMGTTDELNDRFALAVKLYKGQL